MASLTNIREIKATNREVEYQYDEIKRLKDQKLKLLSQISTLTTVLLNTQDHRNRAVQDLEAFGNDHMQYLNSLSQSLQLDVKDATTKIAERSAKLKEKEKLIEEYSEYLTKSIQINEREASQNALQGVRNEEVARCSLLDRKTAKSLLKKAQQHETDTKHDYETAHNLKEETEKLNKSIKGEFNKENNRLKELEKELKLQEDEIIAERKGFINQRENLSKREKALKDRYEAFKRAYEEVKAKAKKAGYMI